MAGGDALVHDHAHGDALFQHDLALAGVGHLPGVAHGDSHAGGAELIHMMVNVVGADAGQIGDQQTGMEGTGLDDGPGQQAVAVGKTEHRAGQPQQTRDLHQNSHDPVQIIGVVILAVFRNVLQHLPLNIKDVVGGLQIDLAHGVLIMAGTKYHHGHGDVIVGVDLLVADKPVQMGELRHGADIGRDDQRQMADRLSFSPFLIHVLLHGFGRDIQRDHVHRIIAPGEKLGNQGVHRVDAFHASAVNSHIFSSFSLIFLSFPALQNGAGHYITGSIKTQRISRPQNALIDLHSYVNRSPCPVLQNERGKSNENSS